MSEEKMEDAVRQGLEREGMEGHVVAAGQFSPRGHSGSLFAGGLAGDSLGGLGGAAGEAVGTVAGSLGGMEANSAVAGLPQYMLVGVTEDAVYGFESRSLGDREPGRLVFQVPRSGLEAKVHQRVNVKVLELIDAESGSRVELEGNRLPVTHSKDVISALTG
jgi:hypothetical protein